MDLYNRLIDRRVPCPLEDNAYFLPLSDIDELITLESINAELSRRDKWFSPSLSRRILEHAKKVFAILVLIQEPGAIKGLIYQDDITDEDLPLYRNGDRGDSEYNVVVSPGSRKIFTSFNTWSKACNVEFFLDKQWLVQAPVFKGNGEHHELDGKCPMPFKTCVTRAKGGSGVVHQGKLHPAHQPAFNTGEIAVKEVKYEDDFVKEKQNLMNIGDLQHQHLIKLIATCEKGSIFYIMFPWADGGSLRDFWKAYDTNDRTYDLLLWSLKQMLGISSAIEALHERNMRHGDIKPHNILHFTKSESTSSSEHGILVIADVGVSRLHTEVTSMRHMATSTREVTISYEAPEAESDRREGKPRSRRYDLWSAGCTFLEFTVWLVYNFRAVKSFRRWRTANDEQTTVPGNFFTRPSDGRAEIHSSVPKALHHLRENPLCGNKTALGDLIQVIEKRLLQVEAGQRAIATELRERLEAIVRSAEEKPEYLLPQVDQIPDIPDFFNRAGSRQGSSSEPAPSRAGS